jgi:cytochrome c oxidase cbb3-type subunit 2
MSDFRKFTIALMVSFGIPWLVLVIIPVIRYQNMGPVAYDKEADGLEGYYPSAVIHRQGQLVYAREGCVQCHSQMIRPAQLTMDGWRKGWGQDQGPRPTEAVRATTIRDFLGEPYAFLGAQRIGPDLANAGWRFEDRALVHQQLYAPRSLDEWSVMPSFRHLYTVRIKQGQGAANAVQVSGKYAPNDGYEVVPSAEAEALVDYVLSLKKDYPVPGVTARLAESK